MIQLGGRTFELAYENKNGWNFEAFRDRYSDVLDRYDYIVGDWGYNQLRLKGFFRDGNPKSSKESSIKTLQEYIQEYCNFGCAYFVLERIQGKKKTSDLHVGDPEYPKEELPKRHQQPHPDHADQDGATGQGSKRSNEQREAKESKERDEKKLRERESKENRAAREQTGAREPRQPRGSQSSRDHKSKEPREGKESPETNKEQTERRRHHHRADHNRKDRNKGNRNNENRDNSHTRNA